MDVVALQAAKADAARKYAPVATGGRRTPIPVADRTSVMSNVSGVAHLSDGTNIAGNYRYWHTLLSDVTALAFAYRNFSASSSNTEADGPNDITVRAALEIPTGTFYPLYWNGNRDRVISPGGYAVTDLAAAGYLTKGTLIRSRTLVSVASAGQKWPTAITTLSTGSEGYVLSTTYQDLTTSGTITNASAEGFGPAMILGLTAPAQQPVVAFVGDSILMGQGDSGFAQGFAIRALNGNIPYIRLAQSGEAAGQAQGTGFMRRAALLRHATHAIIEYGVNDLLVPRTLAQIQAYLIPLWRLAWAQGVVCWQTTITPSTTSTDSWATTANQTINVVAADRNGLNDWIRDGAPITTATMAAAATGTNATGVVRAGQAGHPLAGYFEVADTVETARNSGIWKAGYTTDGRHPNSTGAPAAAAGIDVSKFTLPSWLNLARVIG